MCLLFCNTKSTEPLGVFLGKYIFLWIVKACFFEYTEITFAALPVGANKTDFLLIFHKLDTKVLIVVVLPVPAYPFNKNKDLSFFENRNSTNKENNLDCFVVG